VVTKQRTLEFSTNKGLSGKDDTARDHDHNRLQGADLIDTDDDVEDATGLSEVEDNTGEEMEVVMEAEEGDDDDDDIGGCDNGNIASIATATDAKIHADNGKRKQQPIASGSILRKSIRAKYKGSIVANPYTPVARSTTQPSLITRTFPVKDCETKWRSRFTVRLTIPESSNALATFSTILKGLFTELQATCENEEKVFILPWADKELKTVDAIDTAEDIPTVFSKFRPFITKFFPGNGSEPHTCYFKLHIGHDRDLCVN
jgi:hypothetical protein